MLSMVNYLIVWAQNISDIQLDIWRYVAKADNYSGGVLIYTCCESEVYHKAHNINTTFFQSQTSNINVSSSRYKDQLTITTTFCGYGG